MKSYLRSASQRPTGTVFRMRYAPCSLKPKRMMVLYTPPFVRYCAPNPNRLGRYDLQMVPPLQNLSFCPRLGSYSLWGIFIQVLSVQVLIRAGISIEPEVPHYQNLKWWRPSVVCRKWIQDPRMRIAPLPRGEEPDRTKHPRTGMRTPWQSPWRKKTGHRDSLGFRKRGGQVVGKFRQLR